MQVFASPASVPRGFGPSAVTIGKFDGVHRGHRDVIRQLCESAREDDLRPVVVTFDRHPLSVIRPELAPPPLISAAQKTELLDAAGVDAELVLSFTPEFAALTPEDFARGILSDTLGARVVLAGADFRFGARGAGDLAMLREYGGRFGFEVAAIDDLMLDDGGTPRRASSTWIRELLQEGRVREAGVVLGRRPSVRSVVVPGEQRGRELGYPTANLDPAMEGLLPADGVYAAFALVDDERFGAAVSIGNNPTFEGVPLHQVEAHLLDQRLDLYGRVLTLEFVEYIRPMNRFDGVESLVAQLNADELRIRAILADESGSAQEPGAGPLP